MIVKGVFAKDGKVCRGKVMSTKKSWATFFFKQGRSEVSDNRCGDSIRAWDGRGMHASSLWVIPKHNPVLRPFCR